MIGLFSKNSRAQSLFRVLCNRDTRFVDLGVAKVGRVAKLAALGSSIRTNIQRTRMDAHFSPFQCRSLQRSCEHLLADRPEIESVLYWGATNRPTRRLPYFIISDGPFDPNDYSYPEEWVPKRWASNYLARQRKVYSEARHIFTLSQWAARKIQEVHNISSDNITVIGWGPLHNCLEPTLVPAENNYFVSVGSGWKNKGMDVLATAGELLHATHPESSLLLVGEPRGFDVKPRAGVITMPETIPGEQAQTLIGNARALLVGSRFDASPHVIMEAFQAGTPVIASRVCGIPEVVTPDMGYLVDPGDAEGFALAMRACLEEDVRMQRTRVYRQYLNRFRGWETVALRVVSKIDDVLGPGDKCYRRESQGWQSLCAQP